MESKAISTLRSIKNDNIYTLYEDKIVVYSGKVTKEILLPSDRSVYRSFDSIYYIQNKLFAILITNGNYDMRIEIDEDEIDFSGSPIPTY